MKHEARRVYIKFTTASFEAWLGNQIAAHGGLDPVEVNLKLEKVMRRSFADVVALAQKHRAPLRTAAYMLGIGRVADATRLRGLYG